MRIPVALLLLLVAGCGDQQQTWPVYGMVVFPDGKPLSRGTVEFEAADMEQPVTASGEIAPDGTFQLGTFELQDGAIAGLHRVAVIADFQIGTEYERPGKIPAPLIHRRFTEFDTSGLQFTVEERPNNNFLIEVEYAPKEDPDDDGMSGYDG